MLEMNFNISIKYIFGEQLESEVSEPAWYSYTFQMNVN